MNSPEIADLIEKADRSLSAAEHLYGDGFPDFAASRAYYAMFYTAEALLLSRDLSFSKHSAVIAAFGQHFVKTGTIDAAFHHYLLDAFDLRNLSDYGAVGTISDEDARLVLDNTNSFCLAIKKVLL
jgi:uncharacterized protein (UPF0332 family)